MQDNNYLKRSCPGCGHHSSSNDADVSTAVKAETLSMASLVPHWNGFFKDKVFFSYHRCEGCGLEYAPVFFTPGQLEQLYAQMPANMSEVPLEALRKTQRGYFEALKESGPLNGGFIEIGPDIGLFTENCVREGAFDNYWLFEPNRDVASALGKVMAGEKFQIIHDMFGFSHVPDHSANAAVMIHVLDHLLDPIATLKELRQKLVPGSRLLIVTHDESSLLRKMFGAKWPAFCLQHPQIYNPATITTILGAAGYEVIGQQKTVNYFQVSFLLKHLLWALGLKVNKVPKFWNITIGLRLGNMLTLATPAKSEK